jgi:hypothetical protein
MINWKDMEGSGHDLTLRYYPGISLEGLRKTTRNLSVAGLWADIWTRDLSNAN